MKLTVDMLGYALSRKTDVRISRGGKSVSGFGARRGTFSPIRDFGRPMLAADGSIENGDALLGSGCGGASRVLVLAAPVLEKLASSGMLNLDTLYLCAGSFDNASFEESLVRDANVIVAPVESTNTLLNLAQEVFDQFDSWECRLTEILLEGGSFQAALEATDAVLFHPIALQDNNFHLVAYSNMARERNILGYFTDGRTLTPEVVGNMVRGGAYASIVGNQGPYLFDLREVRGIALNLRHQGKFEGFLLVNVPEMDESLMAYYGDVLIALGRYVGKLLGDRGRFESHWMLSNELGALFAAGLREEPIDSTLWSKALIDSGWSADADLRVLCMGGRNVVDGAIGYLNKAIGQRWPGVPMAQQGEKLAILSTEEELMHKLGTGNPDFGSILRDFDIAVGVSRPLRNCAGVKAAFREAELALSLAPVWDDYKSLTRFDDVILEVLISRATEFLPIESFCDESILELSRIDRVSQTDYLGTIKAYLDARLNAAAAARTLSIQRSTLFYRFNRIKELSGLDMEAADSGRLLHIAFTIRMIDR